MIVRPEGVAQQNSSELAAAAVSQAVDEGLCWRVRAGADRARPCLSYGALPSGPAVMLAGLLATPGRDAHRLPALYGPDPPVDGDGPSAEAPDRADASPCAGRPRL